MIYKQKLFDAGRFPKDCQAALDMEKRLAKNTKGG
jgi:hypothetical protein